jgi:alanyl-tRNA synthetase
MIYCAFLIKGGGIKIIVFAGQDASKLFKAGDVVREVSSKLGGSGGGDARFGQGGGKNASEIDSALEHVKTLIRKSGAA